MFDTVRKCMLAAVAADSAFNIVDVGCGEGYHLERFGRLAEASPEIGTLGLAGIDVSKWAIKAAARRKVPVELACCQQPFGHHSWRVAST